MLDNIVRWFRLLSWMKAERIAKRVVETKIHGRNKKRRPRKTWLGYLMEEVTTRGGRWEYLKQTNTDRIAWRNQCKLVAGV